MVLGIIHGLTALHGPYPWCQIPHRTMTSTQNSSKVTETINSMDYSTGYTYSARNRCDCQWQSITGTSSTVTIDGVNSTWTAWVPNRPLHKQHQVQRSSSRSRITTRFTAHDYPENNRDYKRNGYYKYLPAMLLFTTSQRRDGWWCICYYPVANVRKVTNQLFRFYKVHISRILMERGSVSRTHSKYHSVCHW